MVQFNIEHTSFSLPFKSEKLTHWLYKCASKENIILKYITYIFVDDVTLLEINQTFLNHNYLTDIITFDQSNYFSLQGEIYISVDRMLENANIHNVAPEQEFLRLVAHGYLHLAGYKDTTNHEKMIMRKKEDECIDSFERLNNTF